jgi:hypothetical protein
MDVFLISSDYVQPKNTDCLSSETQTNVVIYEWAAFNLLASSSISSPNDDKDEDERHVIGNAGGSRVLGSWPKTSRARHDWWHEVQQVVFIVSSGYKWTPNEVYKCFSVEYFATVKHEIQSDTLSVQEKMRKRWQSIVPGHARWWELLT